MKEHTLEALHLYKSYNGKTIISDINLTVRSGEVVGLLGPNGAGKTTTFYICVGLIKPDSGQVKFDDIDITDMPMYQRVRFGLSYLPQEASVFRKLTVEENILAILETIDNLTLKEREQRLNYLLTTLGIKEIKNSKGSSLSGGERRRVEIARALAKDPSFILLDEPFAGIDPLAVKDIQNIIKDLQSMNIGILITDHNVRETLYICNRAYILVDGKIIEQGAPEVIASSEKAQKHYLGEDFSLL